VHSKGNGVPVMTDTSKVTATTTFVSTFSHELRTPLNSVHGFIELLMEGCMGQLSQEQEKYPGYAREGVKQPMSIVEDIVLISRSETGHFTINPRELDIADLINQVFHGLQPQALKASVRICKDIPSSPLFVYADSLRIKQVLNNLVTNALKCTPPGGTVTIRVHMKNKKYITILVEDTGYGISLEDQPCIFDLFYQSKHPLQSSVGGLGLGLAISKAIIEQHQSTIQFRSYLNKGTIFFFDLPFYALQHDLSYTGNRQGANSRELS
jgi:signal transduction histidine kinase